MIADALRRLEQALFWTSCYRAWNAPICMERYRFYAAQVEVRAREVARLFHAALLVALREEER